MPCAGFKTIWINCDPCGKAAQLKECSYSLKALLSKMILSVSILCFTANNPPLTTLPALSLRTWEAGSTRAIPQESSFL